MSRPEPSAPVSTPGFLSHLFSLLAFSLIAPIASPETVAQTMRERVSVGAVTVTLTARDGSGRPVRDLRASDLAVFVDGKPVAVDTFVLEPRAATASASGAAVPPAPPPPAGAAATCRAHRRRRNGLLRPPRRVPATRESPARPRPDSALGHDRSFERPQSGRSVPLDSGFQELHRRAGRADRSSPRAPDCQSA
jgi:hypothetical protein